MANKKPPNEIIEKDGYCVMDLYDNKGKCVATTIFDERYKSIVSSYRWSITDKGDVQTKFGGKRIVLHQLILGKKDGYVIDHKNGDRLDNREENLRFATHQQNIMNNKTLGISWYPLLKKWRVRIMKDRKEHNFGYFSSKQEALEIRKKVEKLLFGEFSRKLCQNLI